jgi:hypothetical protein
MTHEENAMPIDLTKHPLELQAAAIIAAATLTAANRFGRDAQPQSQEQQISVEEEVAQRAAAILTNLQEMPWELR